MVLKLQLPIMHTLYFCFLLHTSFQIVSRNTILMLISRTKKIVLEFWLPVILCIAYIKPLFYNENHRQNQEQNKLKRILFNNQVLKKLLDNKTLTPELSLSIGRFLKRPGNAHLKWKIILWISIQRDSKGNLVPLNAHFKILNSQCSN